MSFAHLAPLAEEWFSCRLRILLDCRKGVESIMAFHSEGVCTSNHVQTQRDPFPKFRLPLTRDGAHCNIGLEANGSKLLKEASKAQQWRILCLCAFEQQIHISNLKVSSLASQ